MFIYIRNIAIVINIYTIIDIQLNTDKLKKKHKYLFDFLLVGLFIHKALNNVDTHLIHFNITK